MQNVIDPVFSPPSQKEQKPKTPTAGSAGPVEEKSKEKVQPLPTEGDGPIAQKPKLSQSEKVEDIKRLHTEYLTKFENWAKKKKWVSIKGAYYDWWMFPVRTESSYGSRYTLSEAEIAELKADPHFMKDYRRAVKLVIQAWGWDLESGKAIVPLQKGQGWDGYGVRLAKMSDSLYWFGEDELRKKVENFYKSYCLPQYPTITITDKGWIDASFRPGYEPRVDPSDD
jgi:hypothetical protein